MKWTVIVAALLVVAVSVNADTAHHQQAINRLLYKVTSHIQPEFRDLKEVAGNYNPHDHHGDFDDYGSSVEQLMEELEHGRMLQQKHWFSLFNTRQRKEALMLVDVLLHCNDFNSFKSNAAYFREKVNEGEFVYALYVAVTHSPLTQDVVLPPLYEVTPHLFTNTEVMQKAYSAKMTHVNGNFEMHFTGSKKNKEQRVAYFGEDIGLNSHHVHWHMDFPFWWTGEIDRKGELFFWAHHQLSARYDAERLSNHLPQVDELYWDHKIVDGFAPHTSYKYGGEFPARPDNKKFEDVDGVAHIRDLKQMENRIRDSIAHGFISNPDGSTTELDAEHGINILGNIIESSTYSTNPKYYGALHNQAHRVLGAQSDPHGKFGMPPGVMEHFETATRDPAFFRLHKYMDNIFKEHKDHLPPYTLEDLTYSNVEIKDVKVSALVTFFEDYVFDLSNALDSVPGIADVHVTAHMDRLNHKPFEITVKYHANEASDAALRVYLCPKDDENGMNIPIDVNRWNCILTEAAKVHLESGDHELHIKSTDSHVAIPDRQSFASLIAAADGAVAGHKELETHDHRACGHPQRLLLPKGTTKGMAFRMHVDITSGDDIVQTQPSQGNHGYCGIHGQKYPDKRAMGFPFDRPIPDKRVFLAPKNSHNHILKITHEGHH